MLSARKAQQGFSLVELVTVIIILGILATSISSFLRFGTQSYTDASDREELIGSARFLIERLNREVRYALPNSLRTIGNNEQCLEFMPIDQSVVYLDIPVAPETSSNSISVLMLDSPLSSSTSYVSVYALNSSDIYRRQSGVIEKFSSVVSANDKAQPSIINFSSNVLFNAESPTNRLYFIGGPISYCLENKVVYRYEGYDDGDYNISTGIPGTSATRVMMAEYIENFSLSENIVPFQTIPATLQRNGLVLVQFKFVRNLEEIVFSNEIQVPNVP